MNEKEFGEIVLKEKERSLYMGTVPKSVKESFIQLANEEFAGNFGLCLKWIYDQTIEYQYMKNALFNGLLQSQDKVESKPETKKIKFLSGKEIERRV